MAFYHEIVTVTDVRSTYLAVAGTADDALMLTLIRSVCDDLARVAHRKFTPRVATRYYDAVRDVLQTDARVLMLDDDLLAVTTLTNGDGVVVASDEYVFEPRNDSPRYAIRLLNSSGVVWTYTTDPENAISNLATWGYHTNYADAWQATGNTVNGAHTSSTTSLAYTGSATMNAGSLYKIGSELLYHASASSTPLTVVRGVNGSTAAAMSGGETIYVWTSDAAVTQLARECAAALYRLRDNPLADTFTALDGTVLQTPRDVTAYISKRANELGLVRMAG